MTLLSNATASLCGPNESLHFWDPGLREVSPCFLRVCVLSPAHLGLAVSLVTALYQTSGDSSNLRRRRTPTQKIHLWLRLFSVLLLSVSPVVVGLECVGVGVGGYSLIVLSSIKSVTFLLHLAYVVKLLQGYEPSPRGRKSVLMAWALCAALAVIHTRSTLKIYYPPGPILEKDLMFAQILVDLLGYLLYLITLIPGPTPDDDSEHEERLLVSAAEGNPNFV